MARKKREIREVLMLDEFDNIIAGYKNIQVASEETGISRQTIYSQCRNNNRGRGKYHFIFDSNDRQKEESQKSISISNYVIEEEKPIIKKEKKDMLINLLVEIVNGTVSDGTEVNICDAHYIYDEKSGMLSNLEGTDIYSMLYRREWLVSEISMKLPLLEKEDKVYLQSLISRMDGIKGIRKITTQMDREFLRIEFDNPSEVVVLPEFKLGKYYTSLEENRLYTLEELNLR